MSTIIRPGDFHQGIQPVNTSGKGARSFQQSFARDRNYYVGSKVLSQFTYSGGWVVPIFGNLFMVQGYEFALAGGNEVRGGQAPPSIGPSNPFVPSTNPIVTGLGAQTTFALSYGGFSWTIDQQILYTDYYFHSGASATLQWTDQIIPGKYQISFNGTGPSNTSGTVQIFASNTLLATLTPGQPNPQPVTFSSKDTFRIKAVMTGMGGDFSQLSYFLAALMPPFGWFKVHGGPFRGLPPASTPWEVPGDNPPPGIDGVAWGTQVQLSGDPNLSDTITGAGFKGLPGFTWNIFGTRIGNAS